MQASSVKKGFYVQLIIMDYTVPVSYTHLMLKKKGFLKIFGMILWLVTPVLSFLLLETLTHSVPEDMEWPLIFLNLVFYYLFYGLILVISKRSWVSISLGSLLVMAVGLVNYYVISFRSCLLYTSRCV